MKEMTNNDGTITLKIVEHIMTRNLWEYYVTTNKFNKHIVQCLVMGDFTEIGDVDLDEIKPYIISRTTNFEDIAPASGWRWGK